MGRYRFQLDATIAARSFAEACLKVGLYYLEWGIRDKIALKSQRGELVAADDHNPFLSGHGDIEKVGGTGADFHFSK